MSFKTELRNSIARLLSVSGITSPGRHGHGKLSIVTFHRVLTTSQQRSYPFTGLAVTPEELDIFLSYLTQHFDCGSLATQHDRFLGRETTSRPLLAITFDDAQYDNHSNAHPVLEQHGVKASFFVPVVAVEQQELLWHDRLGFALLSLIRQGPDGQHRLAQLLSAAGLPDNIPPNLVGRVVQASKGLSLDARLHLVEQVAAASGNTPPPEYARLMNYAEIAELAAEGHEIGSHSMTHCMMPECTDTALAYEIGESRRILQDRLGLPIETFCYPNGNSDARTAQAVANAGYRRAVTTTWGHNRQNSDRFRLNRFDMVSRHVQDTQGRFLPALLDFRMSGYFPGLGG